MSWLIKKRRDGKLGWWTTISDGWMTDPPFLEKEEMLEMIVAYKRKNFNQEIRELRKTFPKGWIEKDSRKIISK